MVFSEGKRFLFFLPVIGDLLITGPTGTNVMDLRIMLVKKQRAVGGRNFPRLKGGFWHQGRAARKIRNPNTEIRNIFKTPNSNDQNPGKGKSRVLVIFFFGIRSCFGDSDFGFVFPAAALFDLD